MYDITGFNYSRKNVGLPNDNMIVMETSSKRVLTCFSCGGLGYQIQNCPTSPSFVLLNTHALGRVNKIYSRKTNYKDSNHSIMVNRFKFVTSLSQSQFTEPVQRNTTRKKGTVNKCQLRTNNAHIRQHGQSSPYC